MKKKNVTKGALLASILAMVLCVTMLVGTTFAWFTDTASANVNKIQSGKLDVALEMKDSSGKWVTAEGKTLDFVKAAGGAGQEILWEPGCTYNLPELRVVNNGNLKLKYRIDITGASGDTGLLDVIHFTATVDGTEYSISNGANIVKDVVLEPAGTEGAKNESTLKISGTMDQTAGNTYQGKTVTGIAITVSATQATGEYDSTQNDYDAGAQYPVTASAGVTNVENKVADKNGVTIESAAKVEDGTDPVAKAAVPKDAALEDKTTVLTLKVDEVATPANFTVEENENNKTLEVKLIGLAENNTEPIKVELFVGTGLEGFKLYHNGNEMAAKDSLDAVTADQDYYYNKDSGIVTFLSTNFSPFTYVYQKGNWADHAAESYATPVDEAGKVVTIVSAEELALFAKQVTDEGKNYSGYAVKITSDIDLGENLWKPIKGNGKMSGITIDGGNHTIHNMMVRGRTNQAGYGFAFIGDTDGAITIKNIAFENADVFAYERSETTKKQYAGNVGAIVMGYTYGTAVFENVSVTNSEIWGYGMIGCLLGMGADPGVSVTFKNCTSRNNTVHAAYDMGGLAGMIQRGNGIDNGKVENCVVEGITVDYYPKGSYVDLENVTVTLKSNDQPSGTDVTKTVTGKYLDEAGYYWCGYGDYYVSYGHSSYDAPVEGYDKRLANSEYPVNK